MRIAVVIFAACGASVPASSRVVEPVKGQRIEARSECRSEDECAIAWVPVDCCGTQRAVGVRTEARPALEQRANELQPARCECVASPTMLDDGKTATDPKSIRATCRANACTTVLR